ncbi:MAG: hypothetical protein ABI885_16645, partial [Gammaproteobacteria bacterium]
METDVRRISRVGFAVLVMTILFRGEAFGAQESPAAATAESCRAVRTDPDRLACYDKVFGAPEGSFIEQQPTAPPAAIKEKPLPSLLDERWELSTGQKQGTFRVSPYKPVYILAAY